ncbi:unnamed protein product [Cyberlindnera jadinii]|uniref:ATP-dependent DNA helicase n=1 Tax=Cyberlindnera jadinii (strain ATCC 18201 / CBS 1600 / BCRC 20928 / JCM 3617 / NBRC 0987 / NRRL Y-1542) TaxID=983966 RepID=A0A0H5C461_CYBJN|nr:unnamed protein product [Cyberlindnera jadinii]
MTINGRLFHRVDGLVAQENAPGGSGKTYIENLIVRKLRLQNRVVATCASTGIGSLLLDNGSTAHRLFSIPVVEDGKESIIECPLKMVDDRWGLLKEVELIIWDEISAQSNQCIEAADRLLRKIKDKPEVPFGGIVLLLSGDFRQCLPVIQGITNQEVISANSLFRDSNAKDMKILKLTENLRIFRKDSFTEEQRNDALQISNKLLQIGIGGNVVDFVPNVFETEREFLNQIYPSGLLSSLEFGTAFNLFGNTCILTPFNKSVDAINSKCLQKMTTESFDCIGSDTLEEEFDNIISRNIAKLFHTPRIPPFKLQVKLNTPMILTSNILQTEGLVNGLRVLITEVRSNLIVCQILTGDRKGDIIQLTKIKFKHTCDSKCSVTFTRCQFPLRHCFVMTINKSQGQTFTGKVGIHMNPACFAHGQAYVALSRLTNMNNAYMLLPKELYNNQGEHTIVNKVFEKVAKHITGEINLFHT